MKYLITLLFLSSYVSSYGQTDKASTDVNGTIHFDQLEFNLGVISNKTPVVMDVHYENLGPGLVQFSKVVSPCVCITVHNPKKTIEKGKKSKIGIVLDPSKMQRGEFSHSITVRHNGSDKGTDQIIITGLIE